MRGFERFEEFEGFERFEGRKTKVNEVIIAL